MSRESLLDLNTYTLIGNTRHRGTAWHYRADLQGTEPNHYSGPIPIADVQRRLFDWQAVQLPVAIERPADLLTMTHLNATGSPARWVVVPDRLAVARSDRSDGTVMGMFTESYVPHQYDEWLLGSVANILDDDLSISSAGLLRDGAVAWVEVSVPESIRTPEGVEFRPNLLATTTFDGSLATTYKRTVTNVVCDNTRGLALAEAGLQVKVKHSRRSALRLASARDALAVVHSMAEDFADEIRAMCAIDVEARQWGQFLDGWAPSVDTTGAPLAGRARTTTDRRRAALDDLYRVDPRVAPWAGTAYGVIQAVNTYEHHLRPVRGTDRAARNTLRAVAGQFEAVDRATWNELSPLLSRVTV
ncbi:DUF932 domain-containing protein [Cellulomonas sp. Leaf395]|uniref:DUF932 domain-containing protein n=1 Tax=Cellulomonas sp. Leaf395 TaxID=1736362 RepID=UPI0006F9D946|nr:DUF932 domain-containing protein [Cellulomonas sp. Leaf395]KQS96993.1 hypothetical protein ASG23_15425 [Cellulomonas sp. Leaf395]